MSDPVTAVADGSADPLWVRMVMDVADQLWQAGNKRASGDLHEALRRSREEIAPAGDGTVAALAAEMRGVRTDGPNGILIAGPELGGWIDARAAALAPTVERLVAEGRAEALEGGWYEGYTQAVRDHKSRGDDDARCDWPTSPNPHSIVREGDDR